ncbi:MAG: hypothetical protein FJZ64_04735 [Chlamydiae bacterium]|nr:hypothetical protein [Chlamydiota bacterium]
MQGHADAKCTIYRQHRFRAISLPENMKEEDVQKFKEKEKISNEEIGWEFHKIEPPPDRLSFPVSRRHVILQKARDCSDLLLKVPSKKSNWVYIAPERDLLLIDFLENWS